MERLNYHSRLTLSIICLGLLATCTDKSISNPPETAGTDLIAGTDLQSCDITPVLEKNGCSSFGSHVGPIQGNLVRLLILLVVKDVYF